MTADDSPPAGDATATADGPTTTDDSTHTPSRQPRRIALAGGAGGAAGAGVATTGLLPTIPDPALAGLGAGLAAAVAVLATRRPA